MEKIRQFILLTRFNRPIGYLLLFWPCLWGLTLAFYFNPNSVNYIYFIVLFFLGSVLMRSAGCIINDIVDRKIDIKVKRTKSRPIASGKVGILEAWVYISILCLLALIILLQFNNLTIILGMLSMTLAFSYPFMKRYTYWPQLFLGLTFNWGIIMAWTALNNELNVIPFVLYLSAIFWTLGYDTIYGTQDIADDEIIGVKSTSIKFKENIKIFVSLCYFVSTFFLGVLAFIIDVKVYGYFILILVAMQFSYQIIKFNKNNADSCLKMFKSNNLIGLLIFIFFLSLQVN